MREAGLLRRTVRKLPGYRAVQLLLDFGRGAERRQSALLRIRAQAGLFQPFGTTADDRYPAIFAFLRDALAPDAAVRLLSFGCSTGEEVLTLRRYFPQAHIKGVDISPERIAICRGRVADPGMVFAVAESARGEPAAGYDAVLAMAVFRHGRLDAEGAAVNRIIAFDRFEQAVSDLARAVRPGGYLVIRHANFRFADTGAAAAFDSVLPQDGTAVLYGRDGRRLPPQPCEDAVFRKR